MHGENLNAYANCKILRWINHVHIAMTHHRHDQAKLEWYNFLDFQTIFSGNQQFLIIDSPKTRLIEENFENRPEAVFICPITVKIS